MDTRTDTGKHYFNNEKKNPSFKNKLCVLPFNFQDKKIISGGQSKDAVVVTLLFGPCSVVI